MRSKLAPLAATAPRVWAAGGVKQAQESKTGFYLVLAYLLFEFGRPQELVPILRMIPFGTGLSLLILLNVLSSGKLDFSRLQTKLWIPFFALMAIHVPLARNNFWALMTFKDMFLLFCVYLGIVIFIDSLERMMTLMKIWMGIMFFLALMGVASGGHGIGAWMGDENDFCMVMDMAAPIAYFLLFSVAGFAKKFRYLACLGAFLLGAMASLSRGGFIGLASVGVYCWYRSPKKLNAFVVVAVAVLFMVALAPETYWEEIASSTSDQTMGEDGTGGARLYTWGIGMKMFLYNPIIGIGQKNFPWTFDLYEAGETFHERSFAGREAHSAWVTLVAELGLVGIAIIGLMLLQSYRDLKFVRTRYAPVDVKQKHGQTVREGEDVRIYLARAMEGSMIGYIVSSVFISTLWYPSLWILFGFVVALRNISDEPVAEASPVVLKPGHPRQVTLSRFGARPLSHTR